MTKRPRRPEFTGAARATGRPWRPAILLLVVVLDLGELRVDHVLGLRATRRARTRAGRAGIATLASRSRRVQRLRRLLQGVGLRLDLRLVVALHGGLEVGQRGLDRTDLRA